jgi:hypothetical protein
MAWFWKVKAWAHNWVMRVVGIVVLVAIVWGILWLLGPAKGVWEYLDSLMGFHH